MNKYAAFFAPWRLCVFALTLLLADVSQAAAPKWNILFCFADDWGRYASCYARIDGKPSVNDAIQTPNDDRLAREGVLFRNAFVNAPSCTPCRSSLVSWSLSKESATAQRAPPGQDAGLSRRPARTRSTMLRHVASGHCQGSSASAITLSP